jgi:hypothetical protein
MRAAVAKSLEHLASGSSTVVEHLSHHPKVKGSSPAILLALEEGKCKRIDWSIDSNSSSCRVTKGLKKISQYWEM